VSLRIELESVREAPPVSTGDSTACRVESPTVTLLFRVAAADARDLEALRYARRAMLREEWTLGADPEGASLGDAVFSPTAITWAVAPEQRDRCEARMAELVARANRALREMGRS
jgi:hypothetical protein